MALLESIRLYLYSPSLTFNTLDLDEEERGLIRKTATQFHCRYKVPNGLLPRYHTRLILTTEELIIIPNFSSEPFKYRIDDFEEVTIEEGFLRMYDGSTVVEVQAEGRPGYRFADLVKDIWEKMTKDIDISDLDEKYQESIEETVELAKERESDEI